MQKNSLVDLVHKGGRMLSSGVEKLFPSKQVKKNTNSVESFAKSFENLDSNAKKNQDSSALKTKMNIFVNEDNTHNSEMLNAEIVDRHDGKQDNKSSRLQVTLDFETIDNSDQTKLDRLFNSKSVNNSENRDLVLDKSNIESISTDVETEELDSVISSEEPKNTSENRIDQNIYASVLMQNNVENPVIRPKSDVSGNVECDVEDKSDNALKYYEFDSQFVKMNDGVSAQESSESVDISQVKLTNQTSETELENINLKSSEKRQNNLSVNKNLANLGLKLEQENVIRNRMDNQTKSSEDFFQQLQSDLLINQGKNNLDFDLDVEKNDNIALEELAVDFTSEKRKNNARTDVFNTSKQADNNTAGENIDLLKLDLANSENSNVSTSENIDENLGVENTISDTRNNNVVRSEIATNIRYDIGKYDLNIEQNNDKIVDGIKFHIRDIANKGKEGISLSLYPEHLGRVNITMFSDENNKISQIKIVVHNKEAHDLIMSDINSLGSVVKEINGAENTKLNLELSNDQQSFGANQGNSSGQNFENSYKEYSIDSDGNVTDQLISSLANENSDYTKNNNDVLNIVA